MQHYRFEPVAVNEATDGEESGEGDGETEAGAALDFGRLQNTKW